MTNFVEFKSMLDTSDIEYSVVRNRENAQSRVVLEAKSRGVDGYLGFAAEFIFNADGWLDHVEIWE